MGTEGRQCGHSDPLCHNVGNGGVHGWQLGTQVTRWLGMPFVKMGNVK